MTKFTKVSRVVAFILLLVMILTTLIGCKIVIKRPKKTTATIDDGGFENTNPNPVLDPVDDNYRTLYQIYVRSFADSDGDGIGDIRGIIETFDYLNDGDISSGRDLGVQAIWLTPIFYASSGHKYDAIDFYSVDPDFGTLDDLKELIALCDERNVKLILDLALNHTSTSNEWFKQFKEAHKKGDTSNRYYNFYSWYGSKLNGGYVQVPGQNLWYESWFDTQGGSMPELNYDNPEVRKEMLNVAKYWLDLGIDGFRFDAVKYIYYNDHVKSPAFYKEYTDQLRKWYPDIYLIGECWEESDTNILKYYNSMDCFNFPMRGERTLGSIAKGSSAISSFVTNICSLQQKVTNIRKDAMISCFLSNHDQDRSAGYITADNQRKMAASLYLLTPGTPVIYYGEEIGIKGSGDSPEDANRRLPMKWGDIWTCKVPSYATYSYDVDSNTVYDQVRDENSLMRHYANVLSIRNRYPAIARGTYTGIFTGKSTFGGFQISYNGEKLMLLHNTSPTETVTIDLKTISNLSGYSAFELLEVVGVNDATISGTTLTIGPQTTVLFK